MPGNLTRTPYRAIFALTALLFISACGAAQLNAEEPKPPKPPVVPDKEKTPRTDVKAPPKNPKDDKTVGETVDPTDLDKNPALKNAAFPPPPPVDAPVTQQAAAPKLPPIPEVTLKALVEVAGKPPSALIEVNGKTQMQVSEGSDILVHGAAGGEQQYLALKVIKVSRDGLVLEAPQIKLTIHVK